MAHEVYKNGEKVGELLTADEASARQTGAMVGTATRAIWDLSPMAFILTGLAWLAVTVRTEPFLAHPYIWGALTVSVIACILSGKWAIVFLFLPFTIDHFFPSYYWIGLGLLWLFMTVEAKDTEKDKGTGKAQPEIGAARNGAQAGPPPEGSSHFELIDYTLQINKEGVCNIVTFKFTNPFDKPLQLVEGSINMLDAANQIFYRIPFELADVAPNETIGAKVESNPVEPNTTASKLLVENRGRNVIFKTTRFVFSDGGEQIPNEAP